MTYLRKAAEMALEFVDWLCGDDHSVKPKNNALKTREALRQALAQPEQEPETVMAEYKFQTYAAYKVDGEMKIGVVPEHTAWVTAGKHTVPLEVEPVDAVNISQERVDETAKRRHEPVAWVLYYNNEQGTPMREIFYGKAYMEETKSYNETHRGLKCQVVPLYTAPPKREWVGLEDENLDDVTDEFYKGAVWAEAKLKENNCGA